VNTMKDDFKIIMQLHAEGDAPAAAAPAAVTPAPAATPTPAAASSPAPASTAQPSTPAAPAAPEPAPKQAPAAPDYKVLADTGGGTQLILDANGQKRIITVEPKKEPEPTPVPGTGVEPQPQTANPAPAAQSAPVPGTENPVAPATGNEPKGTDPEPAPANILTGQPPQAAPVYTPEELSLAIQLGAVDESRIPISMAIQYGQYKERLAQQQAIAAGQQQAQQTPKPNEAAQKMEFMKKLEDTARQMTLKELGLTEDDLNDSQYADYSDNPDLGERVKMFNTALEYNRQQIINDVQAKQHQSQQQAASQKAVNDSIIAFTQNEIRTEPKFVEINNALETYYQSLPYGKGAKYAAALNAYKAGTITEQQAQDLQEYYSETKKMVYAKANNLSTTPQPVLRKPAVVESPGTGLDTPKQADPKELSGLDYLGKIAWFSKNT